MFPLYKNVAAPASMSEDEKWTRYVAECMGMSDELVAQFDVSRGAAAESIAEFLIETLFGEAWLATHLVEARKSAADPLNRAASRELHNTVVKLGRYLFDLQPFAYYEDLIRSLRERQKDLRGVMFEAEVAWLLRFIPLESTLRIPTGVKGDDFDAEIELGDDKWAIEAKAKDDIAYSDATVKSTISTARKQLPADGLGTIFIRLPQTWASNDEATENVPRVIANELRNSSRLHAIVTVADHWVNSADDTAQPPQLVATVYMDENCHPHLAHLLKFYEEAWRRVGPFHPIWSGVI